MEDAMIINKSSMERGLCHGTMFKTETIDLKPLRARGDAITTEFKRRAKTPSKGPPKKDDSAPENFIDVDGLPFVGQVKTGELVTLDGKPFHKWDQALNLFFRGVKTVYASFESNG